MVFLRQRWVIPKLRIVESRNHHQDEQGEADTEALLQVIRREFYPNIVTVFVPVTEMSEVAVVIPVASNRQALNGQATAYVCQHQTCQLPVHTPEMLRQQLDSQTA